MTSPAPVLPDDVYSYKVRLASENAAAMVARLVGENKKVLEIGCGPGSQSRVFREVLNCRVVGIEMDPTRAQAARQHCDVVHVADVEETSLAALVGDEKFDVITSADVLEHLRDPGKTVRSLLPLLGNGGYVVASIPNVTHAGVVYEMAHGRFQYRDRGLLDETHLRFFCRRSALALFEGAGFGVAEVHCVTKHPRHTEFGSGLGSGLDGKLMAMIIDLNPDSLTYQFVLKAVPALKDGGVAEGAMLLAERVRLLESEVSAKVKEIRRLEETVKWMESRAPLRLYRRLRGLLGGSGGSGHHG
jgi:2-polyprenyl-3-methyl-5-hydroxy-6-metoxy-1,4-benzoquinol methylase